LKEEPPTSRGRPESIKSFMMLSGPPRRLGRSGRRVKSSYSFRAVVLYLFDDITHFGHFEKLNYPYNRRSAIFKKGSWSVYVLYLKLTKNLSEIAYWLF